MDIYNKEEIIFSVKRINQNIERFFLKDFLVFANSLEKDSYDTIEEIQYLYINGPSIQKNIKKMCPPEFRIIFTNKNKGSISKSQIKRDFVERFFKSNVCRVYGKETWEKQKECMKKHTDKRERNNKQIDLILEKDDVEQIEKNRMELVKDKIIELESQNQLISENIKALKDLINLIQGES